MSARPFPPMYACLQDCTRRVLGRLWRRPALNGKSYLCQACTSLMDGGYIQRNQSPATHHAPKEAPVRDITPATPLQQTETPCRRNQRARLQSYTHGLLLLKSLRIRVEARANVTERAVISRQLQLMQASNNTDTSCPSRTSAEHFDDRPGPCPENERSHPCNDSLCAMIKMVPNRKQETRNTPRSKSSHSGMTYTLTLSSVKMTAKLRHSERAQSPLSCPFSSISIIIAVVGSTTVLVLLQVVFMVWKIVLIISTW